MSNNGKNSAVRVPTGNRSGPKPGNPHSGQFKQGYDSRRNLNGWANMHRQRSIEDKFQVHADKAVERLTKILNDDKAPIASQLAAAREILDRGYGKSVDRLAVANLNGNELSKDPRKMTTKELLAVIQKEEATDEPIPAESKVLSIVKDE